LNSCAAVEGVIHGNELETRPGIEQRVAAETMVGETIVAAAFAEARQWGGPETILLVEDEAFVRKVTAEVLQSAGYRLVIATSAAEALEAYRGCGPFDLLLADVVLPGMSGRELASELESSRPGAKVLLMSGYAEQLAPCELSARGHEYLAKPFSTRMLLSTVRGVLDKPVGGHA